MAAIARSARSPRETATLAYLALYCCGFSGRGSLARFEGIAHAVVDTAFTAGLLAAVEDRRTVSGWTATGSDSERVYLVKDSVSAFAPRSDVEGPIDPPGGAVGVSVPALSPGQRPGFVFRQGSRLPEEAPVTRLYVNLGASHAQWALGPLARALDRRGMPFLVKVLAHHRAYLRRDACVLYVGSHRAKETLGILVGSMKHAGVALRDAVPALTRRLAPGIGAADDLAATGIDEQSFGQWVSRLFLAGAAHSAEPREIADRVVAGIRAAGRSPDHPYRRGRRDDRGS